MVWHQTHILSEREVKDQLSRVDWDFPNSSRGRGIHALHPYPAKFIPEIPNSLIRILSEEGNQVLDPFCGSGTTLVEALINNRKAIGVDINPLAVLISKVKTTRMDQHEASRVRETLSKMETEIDGFLAHESKTECTRPSYAKLSFWFEEKVIHELCFIKKIIDNIDDSTVKNFLNVIFSSIIVRVSRQDSDTRYARVQKNIQTRDVVDIFIRKCRNSLPSFEALPKGFDSKNCKVFCHDALDLPSILGEDSIDLVVTSPPYPNAYTYNLYHRNRLIWLDFDFEGLRKLEIGSHRKYSKKNGADESTFENELDTIFNSLSSICRRGAYSCFVIGNSIIRGKTVDNSVIVSRAAKKNDFEHIVTIPRKIAKNRKTFNPVIGNISNEKIVIARCNK